MLTPTSLHDPQVVATLEALAPDCCPVVAYGALIPPQVIAIPRLGWVNLHFSLLPAWRGAAPVQHAIRAGDTQTGVTTFLIDQGLDTGPVLAQEPCDIGDDETSGALLDRLAISGADLLRRTMDDLAVGAIGPRAQAAECGPPATRITVDDARIDWSRPAPEVDRAIRAFTPAPGAWTTLRGERVKIGPVTVLDSHDLRSGHIEAVAARVCVGTATADVALGEVRPAGKRPMSAADWVRGLRLLPSEVFE